MMEEHISPGLPWQAALTDTRRFPGKVAEVVEASSTNTALCQQFDLFDAGIMQRKSFLDTDAVGNLANCVSGIHRTIFSSGDDALKNLDTFLAALDYPDMDFYGITGTKIWVILPHLF